MRIGQSESGAKGFDDVAPQNRPEPERSLGQPATVMTSTQSDNVPEEREERSDRALAKASTLWPLRDSKQRSVFFERESVL